MNLTKPQIRMLEEASTLPKLYRSDGEQWFIPGWGENDTVFGTKATAKALCAKGLLEYRVAFEAVGRLPEIIEFRITEDGRGIMTKRKEQS